MARRKQTLGTKVAKAKTALTKKVRRVAKRINRRRKAITKATTKVYRKQKRGLTKEVKALKKQAGKRYKNTVRYGLKASRKSQKQVIRRAKQAKRLLRRRLKKLPGQARKAKRLLRRNRKRFARFVRITRKEFKKRSRAFQLRGRKLTQRRQERRQEIHGAFDTSRSVVTQASGDPGASRPGEPPKMRTGNGRNAIKAEVRQRGKQIVSRTYVDKKVAKYMAMWEFRQDGKQRPFLKPGLMNNLGAFQTKVGAELKRAATPVAKKKAIVK